MPSEVPEQEIQSSKPETPESEHVPVVQPPQPDTFKVAGERKSGEAPSLIDCIRSGTLSIPRKYKEQKGFLRFVRKASTDPRFLQQVRQFRDAVILSAMQGQEEIPGGLTIGITGVAGGEGASILALLLSLSFGECTQRRAAFLDARFDFQRFSAISDVLQLSRNSVHIPKGFEQVNGYCNPAYPNLYFLRSSGVETGMTFLSDKRLGQFLGDLRKRFDFTILDLPPLLGETAGVFVLPCIDRLYLAVEAGRTRLSQVQRCFEVTERAGCKIHGAILNKQAAPWWTRLFWRDFFF